MTGGSSPQIGAFNARVTAAPGTGFLPKPNLFVPGVEKSLGPLPKKLVKGDYPQEYVFAKGDVRMGIMLWPDSKSAIRKKAIKAPAAGANGREGAGQSSSPSTQHLEANERETKSMAACASAPQLAKTTPSFFGRNRPPSGHRAQMAEARL